METIILCFEELEALRLADFEAKKQEEAAEIMNISRATFGRIVERARFIVADALLNSKAIVIKGGEFCWRDLSNIGGYNDIKKFFLEKQKKCLNCRKYQMLHCVSNNSAVNSNL